MTSFPTSTPAYTDRQRLEAADWFVAIHAENDPKAESIQAWLRWMDQHEGNRAAFDAVARAWHGASSAAPMPSEAELLSDEYDGDQSVEEWLATRAQVSAEPLRNSGSRFDRTRMPKRAWLAAAAVILTVLGVLTTRFDLNSLRSDEFATRTGETIEITLADGSRVWLGPKSKLSVRFNDEQRGIDLAVGEAFFSVKKDPSRPFTVRSQGGDIVAVGTAFNVRAVDARVTVAVSEGIVAVMPREQHPVPKPASVRVTSGQQVTFVAQQSVKALAVVQSPTLGERARWRDGVLVYRDEPLHDVVSDLVRYANIEIEIADTAVGDLRYSGVIYHDAVHEWVSALPESFPVTVVSEGAREIIKSR